jgi:hypothetical protein
MISLGRTISDHQITIILTMITLFFIFNILPVNLKHGKSSTLVIPLPCVHLCTLYYEKEVCVKKYSVFEGTLTIDLKLISGSLNVKFLNYQ